MAAWPARGQQAPDYWDDMLKAYIDAGDAVAAPVTSVNGETGAVVLDAGEVGAAPAIHNHDDRYYTETEVTALLAGKSDTGHTHTGYAPVRATINAQTGTAYTPVLADENKLVTLTNAAAITVTLPTDANVAIPVGGRIDFAGLGVGLVTFAAAAGASVVATPSLVTRARYSAVSAFKIAANTWLLVGDLA